jgi:hypothetical protein
MNYYETTREIEIELVRKGIVLGIDWSNEILVRKLANEAINHIKEDVEQAAHNPLDLQLRAKLELFGLAGLMLKAMTASADRGFEAHGGDIWKIFAKALWAELPVKR